MNHLLRCLTLMSLAFALCPATAQDWPWWRGPGRDGKVAGFVPPAQWPGELNQVWRVPVGSGDATPALVGGRLFAFGRVAEDEVVFCLDAGTGREVWRHAYPAVAVTGPAEKYAGPRSSPAVADGKVVTLGVGGVLTCLDAGSGKLLWRQEALADQVPRFFTAMSPLVVEGRCVAHLGGQGTGRLVALDLATGAEKWSWRGEGPSYSSPTLVTNNGTPQVVVQTEASLAGLALAEGKLLWQVPTAPRPGYWNSASPVPAGGLLIYSGQGTGTRAVRIEAEGGAWVAREVWHNRELGTVYNTPVLRDGRLYALSDRGRFFCLDKDTGATLWVNTNRFSNFGALVDTGPVLLALPEKSGLIWFKPGAESFEEVARHPVADTPVYATPVVAGRRIFVRDAASVTAWEWGE